MLISAANMPPAVLSISQTPVVPANAGQSGITQGILPHFMYCLPSLQALPTFSPRVK